MAEWVDGTGQFLTGIHLRGQCVGDWCVIHRPMPGPWEDWTTYWNETEKLMYRICPHGYGHPAAEEIVRDWRVAVWATGHTCCSWCRCIPTLTNGNWIEGEAIVRHVIES